MIEVEDRNAERAAKNWEIAAEIMKRITSDEPFVVEESYWRRSYAYAPGVYVHCVALGSARNRMGSVMRFAVSRFPTTTSGGATWFTRRDLDKLTNGRIKGLAARIRAAAVNLAARVAYENGQVAIRQDDIQRRTLTMKALAGNVAVFDASVRNDPNMVATLLSDGPVIGAYVEEAGEAPRDPCLIRLTIDCTSLMDAVAIWKLAVEQAARGKEAAG